MADVDNFFEPVPARLHYPDRTVAAEVMALEYEYIETIERSDDNANR